MVPKADGSWRPCGDYRRLNTVTTPDRYPLPSMLDLSAKLHGCKFFSCVDLVKGYHQIPMAVEDIEKTAIITPFGLFEYLFMPFGLTNAAQSFQRLMDKLFRHTCHSSSRTWTTISSPAAPWKSICYIYSSFFRCCRRTG